jgi:alpha-D-xyloside xylohydrolase
MRENEMNRNVCLPPGSRIDYQSGKDYTGGWQKIPSCTMPAIIMVRDGTVVPELKLEQVQPTSS